jgi:hypothetical protein
MTPEWVSENRDLIFTYRDWIPNFGKVHPDITSKTFRKLCTDTEYTIDFLCQSIYRTNTFDPTVYVTLLRQMKEICEMVFDDKDMAELMKSMSL